MLEAKIKTKQDILDTIYDFSQRINELNLKVAKLHVKLCEGALVITNLERKHRIEGEGVLKKNFNKQGLLNIMDTSGKLLVTIQEEYKNQLESLKIQKQKLKKWAKYDQEQAKIN